MCGVQGCCPVVAIKENVVTITDDYKDSVKMTKAQFDEIVREATEKD